MHAYIFDMRESALTEDLGKDSNSWLQELSTIRGGGGGGEVEMGVMKDFVELRGELQNC